MSSLSAWSSKYPSDNDNLTWSEIQNKHTPFYFFAGGKIVWKLCWKLGRHSLLKLTIVLSLSCETYSISWVKPRVGFLSSHQNGSVQDSKFSERLFPLISIRSCHFLFLSVDLDCETYFENSFRPFVFLKSINFRFKWIVFLGQIFEVTFKTSIRELWKKINLKT